VPPYNTDFKFPYTEAHNALDKAVLYLVKADFSFFDEQTSEVPPSLQLYDFRNLPLHQLLCGGRFVSYVLQ